MVEPIAEQPVRTVEPPEITGITDIAEAEIAPTVEAAMGQGRIVVGVDGSGPSLHALRWADRQSALTGATVEAVIAWEMPSSFGWGGAAPSMPETFDLGASTEQALAEAVAEALPPDRALAVNQVVVTGNAAQALIDRAQGADLIVVGARGHGTFRAALLGSVSQSVALHAPCPVVVIRGEGERVG